MEEEFLKRNTDCVYFLASPLTCKKGIDCEYRHSEVARLNPRDCWYWLAGSCLNPACAFRHPPLDEYKEASSSEAHFLQESSVNKTNIPCYFYTNGVCSKGERCPFMHGHNDAATASQKASKAASAITAVKKTSAESHTGSSGIEKHQNQSSIVLKPTLQPRSPSQPKEPLEPSVPCGPVNPSASPQVSVSEYEEVEEAEAEAEEVDVEVKSDSLLYDSVNNESIQSPDQSSDEQADDQWWESSPGLDVLVDGRSENLVYNEANDLDTDLDIQFLPYHYIEHPEYDPDHAEYDPAYSVAENFYESRVHESCDNSSIEQILPEFSRSRMLDPIPSRKRRGNGLDLRDHLSKRRVTVDRSISRVSRRHKISHLIDHRSRERPPSSNQGLVRRSHGRLRSEVGNDGFRLRGTVYYGSRSHPNRSRQHPKAKWPSTPRFPSSEVSRNVRCVKDSGGFSGPKSLAQIKEEKREASGNRDCFVKFDFRGPKPLSDILRDKGRLNSTGDRDNFE